MKLPSYRRTSSVSINMTPMIDVVFQLIVFFLVSSHLAKQEALLPLPLPLAQTGQVADPRAHRAIINVLADGRIQIHGRPVTQAGLKEVLGRLQQERGTVEVRVRADRNVPYRYVQPVLVACWQAGVEQVTFAVYRDRAE